MTAADYAFLLEILDRGESILQSSPSSDRSLSFLRILAAYDQILLRHDMTPSQDTAVFQWLVTLNIHTEDDAAARFAQDEGTHGHAHAHAKQYQNWKRKLDQLYWAGEAQRQAAQPQQPQQQQSDGAPLSASARLHDRELSIDSLSSSAASPFHSPHVSFAKHAAPPAAASARPGGAHPAAKSLTSSLAGSRSRTDRRPSSRPEGERQYGEGALQEPSSGSTSSAGDMDEKLEGDSASDTADAEADQEQAFLELLRAGSRKQSASSVPNRQQLISCFRAWRTLTRPRFELLPLLHAARHARAASVAKRVVAVWRAAMADARYHRSLEQRLQQYEQRHGGSAQFQLFHFWLREAAKRQLFKAKQRQTHVGVAFQRWTGWLRNRAYNRNLQLQAMRKERIFQWQFVVRRWTRFCRRQRRIDKRLEAVRERQRRSHVAEWWTQWRSRFASAQHFQHACARHLLLLQQQQMLVHWASSTRLLHSPSHRAILTVQQFHILWRWLGCSFGSGYELMRIIWLSKIKYQQAATAQPSIHEQELQRQRRKRQEQEMGAAFDQSPLPTPSTHPFVAGPPVHSSFAATATAPFAHSLDQSMNFAYTLPSVSFVPSSPPRRSGASAGPPVLGSPVSSLGLAAAPHVDAALPMQHAMLAMLNRSLRFRRHKLAPLLGMVQLWSRWYLKHLFVHWRANIALKQQQRAAQQRHMQMVAVLETHKEAQAVKVHSRGLLVRAMERWIDSFHKSAYYSLLLRNLYARQHRRLVSEHYVRWKYLFVATRARSLFRLRRGIRSWRQCLTDGSTQRRKYAIVQFKRQRQLVSLVWSHWRLTLQRERDTKAAMLSMLWQRWKSSYVLRVSRAQEHRDAATYYSLKLLLRSLLTWRALSITVSIASKYTHRAVHHHHSQLQHRHIVWWVNWKRYKTDSRRMQIFARQRHERELTLAAVKLWTDNTRARRQRHQRLRECTVFVRNKHLAFLALRLWRYALACLYRSRRIQSVTRHHAQLRAWLLWLQCIRVKNAQYEQLEAEVMVRRDYNRMGALFHNWLQCSRDMAKAARLHRHCETVWYYSLVKRLFRSWRHVAVAVHPRQLAEAAEFHADAGEKFRAVTCIRKWRGVLQHKAKYAQLVRDTHVRLQKRFHLLRWFRLWQLQFGRERACNAFQRRHHARFLLLSQWTQWRAQFQVSCENNRRIAVVVALQQGHTLRALFAHWSGPFVAHSQLRRRRLAQVCDRMRTLYLRRVLAEWKSFRSESRMHAQADEFRRRALLCTLYRSWKAAHLQHCRTRHLEECAVRVHSRATLQRVYSSWKASCRAGLIHQLFLCKKTFLSWRRHARSQSQQAHVADEFRDTAHSRRLQFAFRVWRRYGVHFRKQERKLADRHRSALTANVRDRVELWHNWAHARTQARQSVLSITANAAVQRQARWFAHWTNLYEQRNWDRSLLQLAARTHARSALIRTVRRWSRNAFTSARMRALERQVTSRTHATLLARMVAAWRQAEQSGIARLAMLVARFRRPRMALIYSRWKAATGRRSCILHLHRAYLQRTLCTWQENARESRRSRVWEPLADAHYRRTLAGVALRHWFKYRAVHRAAMSVQPRAQQRLRRAALHHWLAALELRRAVTDFAERAAQRRIRRTRKAAVAKWRSRVAQRHAYAAQADRVREVAAFQLAARFYGAWRNRLRAQRLLVQQSALFFRSRPCARMVRLVFMHWRERFGLVLSGLAIDRRGSTHAQHVTHPRRLLSRFRQWRSVSHYSSRVRSHAQTLTQRVDGRALTKLFDVWRVLSRRRLGAHRLVRALTLQACRRALRGWTQWIDTLRKQDWMAHRHALRVQRDRLAHWWTLFKQRQRDRAEVQLLHSRIRLASSQGRRSWLRAKQLLVPVLKAWMSPESSLKFYLRVLRAYTQQCRSFRDADDAAARHYERAVLTPSSWREWRLACVASHQQRQAHMCMRRQAQRRFLAQLRRMILRRARRAQQANFAAHHHRRVTLAQGLQHWRALALALQQQRVSLHIQGKQQRA